MPGALPQATRVRRNAPTIPTTRLSVAGRKGRIPKVPKWIVLGDRGLAWWLWAWRRPQAMAWDSGSHVVVARRAMLEDLLDGAVVAGSKVEGLLSRMESLDVQLGLTPKAMAQLRWLIVADEAGEDLGVLNELADRKAVRRAAAERVRADSAADSAR